MKNKKPYYEFSKVTGKEYDLWSVIRILNPRQAAFYVSRGLEIQDIEASTDRRTGEPVLVFYFIKEDTKELFDEWCRRKQERNGEMKSSLGDKDGDTGD